MYCIPFSFKDPYEVKDLRSTGGADARYDIDFARAITRSSRSCARRAPSSTRRRTPPRSTGAAGDPGGRTTRRRCCRRRIGISAARGPAIRATRPTRRGPRRSGRAPDRAFRSSTNLVMCSLCEETGQSCRGPANHNSVALILPHKAMLSFLGGAVGSKIYNDRAGIHCRSIADAVKVLDALEGSGQRLLRPARHLHHRAAVEQYPAEPYARRSPAAPGRAQGHAHRHHPRVHGQAREGGRADRGRGGGRDEEPCSASTSAQRWWNRSRPAGWTIPTSRTCRPRSIARSPRSRRSSSRTALPLTRAGEPEFPAFAAEDRADRVRPRVVKRHRHDAAGRLDGPLGRRPRAHAEPHAARRARRRRGVAHVPLSHGAVPDAARPGLGRSRLPRR